MRLLKENKVLFLNFSSLSVLQISNYLFPLITFPYLVRVLGPEKYGLVNFAAAFVTYFSMLTDYGFNISGTQIISLVRDNQRKLKKNFWTIFFVKAILFTLSIFIFLPLVFFIGKFSSESLFYFVSFLMVFGTVLFPQWFFQGMEKMHYITLVNIGVKSLWVVSVFIFIRHPDDALKLVLLNSVSFILIGLLGFTLVIVNFGIGFYLPKISEIKEQFIKGWYVFLSTVSISLYTNSNIFILGLFTNNEVVGYFAGADKIRIAIQGIFGNAGQSIFPHVSRLFKESLEKATGFLRQYLKIIIISGGVVTVASFLFANELTLLLLGQKYVASISILEILIFLPLLIALSNIYGIQIMLNTGHKKEFTKIVFSAGVLNTVLALVLVPYLQAIGSAIAVLTAEIFVTTAMWRFVKRKRIL